MRSYLFDAMVHLLSVAQNERAEVFTSDHGIRDACRSLDMEVSYLPLKDILA